MYSSFKKHNIDTFGITDAVAYNKIMKTDYMSIIVALFPYYCGINEKSPLSIYTHGKDYHSVIRKILTEVAYDLKLSEYAIHTDVGPEIERKLAIDAGLCFKGKNSMCINEKYGSYFFIGYIACNEKFKFSKLNTLSCIECGKCISACPGGALTNGFDETKCLSAITQKKQNLNAFEKGLIKNNGYIFGCDICQRVCPHNENAAFSEIDEFVNDRIFDLDIDELKSMSNKEFKEKYKDRAFSWRGKKLLVRNIDILKK